MLLGKDIAATLKYPRTRVILKGYTTFYRLPSNMIILSHNRLKRAIYRKSHNIEYKFF